jgi:soluble lytic murein transglycosylase
MNKLIILLCGLIWSITSFSLSGQAYMERFNTFSSWYQQLPFVPSSDFLEFVKGSTPLANKLRDKWLYELARLKDWKQYVAYYQPTGDINLVCYNQMARYNLGQEEEVLNDSASIWLIGESRPQACTNLFDLLLKNEKFDQDLITQRITLALDKKNISLARYLLKHYKVPRSKEADLLAAIHQRPMNITTLEPGEFNSNLYLYGLKRLLSINMDKAIQVWEQPRTKTIMNEAHEQAFLAHIALYKAMRNSEDTLVWFNKIKPQYYNDVLVDWQIRFALKQGHWSRVAKLINNSKNKELPCWQYWLARSLEAQGGKEEARAIYEPLAKSRQYYGFLASMRLHQKPSFENEKVNTDLTTLKPYQLIIDQIHSLHLAKQDVQATRLLNDFISELPKEDASALVYWVDSTLQWHSKSLYLSNSDKLNDQLSLRFPLAYRNIVKNYAQEYLVPPEFVYAIIRQESGFREDVVSVAGARGLMQVMPRTASVVSKMSKIPYTNHDELFLSQKNINIGIAYLQQLTKRFSNHPVLVAAAYNAGPGQVVYWLKNHPPKEIDLWIETLPWQETRNYLKNVMAFAVVYQYRLNQKPNLAPFLMQL